MWVFQADCDKERQHNLTVHAVPALKLAVFQTVSLVSCHSLVFPEIKHGLGHRENKTKSEERLEHEVGGRDAPVIFKLKAVQKKMCGRGKAVVSFRVFQILVEQEELWF